VGAGESLARPLGASGLFDEDVVEMIMVGESSNTLPTVLVGVADTAERRTDRILEGMLKLMEPVLLLFLAAAVMFVFLALVVPMMQLGTQLG
jgi:general secretion pathway protein F/type IV pilus assembly protein PilC